MLDVTPLFKYELGGKDAAAFLSRFTVRDLSTLKPGRATYLCWCDDAGKVLDDGTVMRFDDDHYRLTATLPSFHWLDQLARGYEVSIRDATQEIAALAVQGPTSRELLKQTCDAPLDRMRFFSAKRCTFGENISGEITRTGYTGDLGYELWVKNKDALALWDLLIVEGKNYGLRPIGLDALDMSRVEAGFIMQGVDYHSARVCLIEQQKSTPFELDLGWTVDLEREPFVGQAALKNERDTGSKWQLVGLEVDWAAVEALYGSYGLPPQLPVAAWRSAIPIYLDDGELQIGRATSGTWSPLLKRNLALATVETQYAAIGTPLRIEMTVEYERKKVPAKVVEKPFFDPHRKKSIVRKKNVARSESESEASP